jgi:hypothetical protein
MKDDHSEFEYSSPMEEAAIGMHEVYMTLRKAGFSRRDGLELVARMLFMGMTEEVSMQLEIEEEEDDE